MPMTMPWSGRDRSWLWLWLWLWLWPWLWLTAVVRVLSRIVLKRIRTRSQPQYLVQHFHARKHPASSPRHNFSHSCTKRQRR